MKWKRGKISFKNKKSNLDNLNEDIQPPVNIYGDIQPTLAIENNNINNFQVRYASIRSTRSKNEENEKKNYQLEPKLSFNDNDQTNVSLKSFSNDNAARKIENIVESNKSNESDESDESDESIQSETSDQTDKSKEYDVKNIETNSNKHDISINISYVLEREPVALSSIQSVKNVRFDLRDNNSITLDTTETSSDSESEDNSNELSDWLDAIKSMQKNKKLCDYVLSRPKESFTSLSDLKIYLFKSPANSDLEKAWVIYLWVTQNIEFDIENYVNGSLGNQNSNTVFKTGYSISTGYSNLSKDLLDYFSIKSVIIEGYSKANAFEYEIGKKFSKVNHDWIAIFIDSKWAFVESTWGAGAFNPITLNYIRKFDPHCFLIPPSIFIHQNFPLKNEYQFLDELIKLNEF